MTIELKTNTAVRITVGPFLDKTDGITPEVALTATNEKLTLVVDTGGVPTLVLDANATASGGSNDFVHITGDDAGYYDLELTAAQLNYLGNAKLAITYATDHLPVFQDIQIVSAQYWDAKYGSGNFSADLKAITAGVDFSATMKTSIETACDATVGGGTGTALTAIPWNPAWDAEVESEVDDALGGGTGTALTAIPWNAAWDAEVQSEVQDAIEVNHLDHLLAVDYDPASKPGIATALLNELVENDGGVSRYTVNALENAPSESGASAEAIADAVWDELSTGHTDAGKAGAQMWTDVDAIATDVAGLDGAAMRGTDNAALASVCTEGRLSELDAANLPTDVANVKSDTAAILTDTGTTLDGKIDTIDTNVDSILVDTGTTLDGKVDAIKAITDVLKVKKNAALNNFTFMMVDSADHVTPKTGLTVTCQRSIDGGAFGNCTNATATEIANGWYKVDLTDTDLNGTVIALKFTSAGADATNIMIVTQP